MSKVQSPDEFFSLDYNQLKRELVGKKNWQSEGEVSALALFHEASHRVPAYKHFLKKHKINPKLIKTYDDFKNVPYADKKNYVDLYALEELVWDGTLNGSCVINSSSGTTGQPYFWPCSQDQIVQGAVIKEFVYNTSFNISKYKSLLVICFGMGTWIAGYYTLVTSQMVGDKGYPLSIITPGFNKQETIRLLVKLAPKYDQVIIAGIPTFIKDLLEEIKNGRNIVKPGQLKLLFAGEGFSETWREYVLKLARSNNYFRDSVSILGSAETAMMGFETPLSVLVRKIASENIGVCRTLFDSERVPTLQNYIPSIRFFEKVGDELVISANRSVPLIRYNIHDQGGIRSFTSMQNLLVSTGNCLMSELEKRGLDADYTQLPFLYVFGRGKFVVTLYGVNIYPENIREVLIDDNLRHLVTGKFVIETKYKKNQDQYLRLDIELAQGVRTDSCLLQLTTKVFLARVRSLNSEYNRMAQEYGRKAIPKIIFHEYEKSNLFPTDRVKKSS